MKLKRRTWLYAAATIVVVIAAVIVWEVWLEDYPVRQFGVVEEGVLYRSAQPTEAAWRRLRDDYKIRTVVSLREEEPDAAWCQLEKQFCAANGIGYVSMPIGPYEITDEQLQTLLKLIGDPQRQPVLVHCELGKARTGVAVAAYRIAANRWSCRSAVEEAQNYKKHLDVAYVGYLWGLSRVCDRK
ncbi:MAG: tyrosine-protein phosphatase [Planctomycetaceae bacterium]|nr:tyrosine-protein phosphatase [Planctomycetaceae bacterium]